jgi:hypothetical protein
MTLEIGLLYGPGGQPFHRGNFNGDPSAIWVNYVDRVYVVNISISMSMSSLPTSTMRRLRLQTKHAELNRLVTWLVPASHENSAPIRLLGRLLAWYSRNSVPRSC